MPKSPQKVDTKSVPFENDIFCKVKLLINKYKVIKQ